MTVFVLYIAIASRALAGYDWHFIKEIGEYPTMDECRKAVEAAEYRFGDNPKWKPFNDGAICIPRMKP
jgi:hypothetical protein